MKFIYRENLEGKCEAVPLEGKIKFDGGVNPKEWSANSFPFDKIPDEYVQMCKDEAINLHIFRLGKYKECSGCKYERECLNTAIISKEQASF